MKYYCSWTSRWSALTGVRSQITSCVNTCSHLSVFVIQGQFLSWMNVSQGKTVSGVFSGSEKMYLLTKIRHLEWNCLQLCNLTNVLCLNDIAYVLCLGLQNEGKLLGNSRKFKKCTIHFLTLCNPSNVCSQFVAEASSLFTRAIGMGTSGMTVTGYAGLCCV